MACNEDNCLKFRTCNFYFSLISSSLWVHKVHLKFIAYANDTWFDFQHRLTFVDQKMLNTVATCWNIDVLVECSFNICWSTTTYFGAKLKCWTTKCCCRFVLRALSPLSWSIDKKTKKPQNLDARMDLLTRCSEFCCNLYQRFVSHVTIFVICRSYIVQARKILVQIDQLTGVIKTPVELNCFQLFSRHVDIFRKPRDTKLENEWLKPFSKRQLVERNTAMLSFFFNNVQQLSTCWTAYFNIQHHMIHCSTFAVATFVAQQMLNRVSSALLVVSVFPYTILISPTSLNQYAIPCSNKAVI